MSNTKLQKDQDEIKAIEVANLVASGFRLSRISRDLGIGMQTVHRLMRTQAYKKAIEDLKFEVMQAAKNNIQHAVALLGDKVVKVLSKHLDDDNLQAVPIALKVIGADQEIQSVKQDNNITVVLPGVAQQPTKVNDIEVEADEVS